MPAKNGGENLEDHTVEELREIAAEEGAEISSHSTKAELVKAIEKNRKKTGDANAGAANDPGARRTSGTKGGNQPGEPEPEAIRLQRERFEQTNYGPEPLPADDPRRAPRPEDVDHVAEAERLEKNDREFRANQGLKEQPATATEKG